ncbi:phosphatase 2C-like domain-containing protein [Schizophyllum fasciatum]
MFRPFLRQALRTGSGASLVRPVPLSRGARAAVVLGVGFSVGSGILCSQRLYADTEEHRQSEDDEAKRERLTALSVQPAWEMHEGKWFPNEDPGVTLDKKVLDMHSSPAPGVAHLETFRLESNFPCEDHLSWQVSPLPGPAQNWVHLGIYDGHNGEATSRWLRFALPDAVVGALADLYSKHAALASLSSVDENSELAPIADLVGLIHPPPEEIDQAIKEAFLQVDDDIVHWSAERALAGPSDGRAQQLLAPALAGSCALLAFFDTDSRELRMALTGDSRAVLARPARDADGRARWRALALTQDQNAHNEREMARMEGEHPGETIGANGRVLGWGMARAFGDAAYKWARELQMRLYEGYLCDYPRKNVKTPPYFTAEPEITTTVVQPGDVLVMASDGLWDCLTNEEVAGLVGAWMEKKKVDQGMSRWKAGHFPSFEDARYDAIERSQLPVLGMKPDHTKMYAWWHADKHFVNVDDTLTAHLARNALGGANVNLTSALLQIEPPRSRRYKDDISIIVAVFE